MNTSWELLRVIKKNIKGFVRKGVSVGLNHAGFFFGRAPVPDVGRYFYFQPDRKDVSFPGG